MLQQGLSKHVVPLFKVRCRVLHCCVPHSQLQSCWCQQQRIATQAANSLEPPKKRRRKGKKARRWRSPKGWSSIPVEERKLRVARGYDLWLTEHHGDMRSIGKEAKEAQCHPRMLQRHIKGQHVARIGVKGRTPLVPKGVQMLIMGSIVMSNTTGTVTNTVPSRAALGALAREISDDVHAYDSKKPTDLASTGISCARAMQRSVKEFFPKPRYAVRAASDHLESSIHNIENCPLPIRRRLDKVHADCAVKATPEAASATLLTAESFMKEHEWPGNPAWAAGEAAMPASNLLFMDEIGNIQQKDEQMTPKGMTFCFSRGKRLVSKTPGTSIPS